MKRYGLPALVSAIYLTAMLFVFSSDYSKENTFLYPDTSEEVCNLPSSKDDVKAGPSSETPNPIQIAPATEGEDPEKELPSQPEHNSPEHHSPEASEGE